MEGATEGKRAGGRDRLHRPAADDREGVSRDSEDARARTPKRRRLLRALFRVPGGSGTRKKAGDARIFGLRDRCSERLPRKMKAQHTLRQNDAACFAPSSEARDPGLGRKRETFVTTSTDVDKVLSVSRNSEGATHLASKRRVVLRALFPGPRKRNLEEGGRRDVYRRPIADIGTYVSRDGEGASRAPSTRDVLRLAPSSEARESGTRKKAGDVATRARKKTGLPFYVSRGGEGARSSTSLKGTLASSRPLPSPRDKARISIPLPLPSPSVKDSPERESPRSGAVFNDLPGSHASARTHPQAARRSTAGPSGTHALPPR